MTESDETATTTEWEQYHAIVTGGTRGIGAAIAAALAQRGARVTITGRNADAVELAARTVAQQHHAEVLGVVCDVTDVTSIQTAFGAARDTLGHPHILINNAGQGYSARFLDTSLDAWNQLLSVNLTGAFLCTQQVLPTMLDTRQGRIVNIASTAGLKGYARTAAYCASKHALVGLTRALAAETAKSGITVNAVCPGYTETDMAQQAVENLMTNRGISEAEARQMLVRGIPRGVLTTPEEVANTVVWLCSPEAGAVTGLSVAVAGGEVM